MPPRIARAWVVAAAVLAAGARGAGAQHVAAEAQRGVTIRVLLENDSLARVTERYRLPPDTAGLQLQLLRRDCADVGPVSISRGMAAATLTPEVKGPWTTLRDTALRAGTDTSTVEVRYTVALRGRSGDIPLVHARRAVPRGDSDREGDVTVTVAAGAVRFPRMSRAAPGEPWTGRFVAIPSFVRVERAAANAGPFGACTGSESAQLPDGGLTWRFWLLVGIMATWVPVYLAWARRVPEGAQG